MVCSALVAVSLQQGAVLADAADDVLEHVDPFIGTEGKGNTLPGPTAPFALIQPGPDSGSVDIAGRKNPRYCNGYKRDDARIIGFTQTHLSGTGCPDLCDFLILPFTGDEPVWGLKDRGTETSRPGYYSVFFTNTHVRTEIAATRRCGVYRMTWAAGARPRLLVDLQHGNVATYSGLANSNHVLASSSRIDVQRRRLYADNHVQAWLQNRHVAGVFEFGRPIAAVKELPLEPGNKAKRYVLDFEAAAEPLEVKVSVSGVDSAGAERNLDAELGTGPAFERARMETENAWRALLGRVRAKATPDALKLVYTALYHCFQQPNLFSDVDGRYRNAAAEIDRTDGEYYTGFSLWDTFRAVHPLYTILAPEKVDVFVNSFLSQYRSVGYLPTIPYFGRETFCMIGVHSIPVITDAWLKGFRGFDGEEALAAVTNALTVTHRHRPRAEWWVPDENWELLDRFGYYPWDFTFNQGVSRTLEIAYDEACAAALARAMGKEDVAVLFDARSHRWTNHFDRATLLMRGRGANGKWREPFDPVRRTYCTQQGGDYTESNAREYTWFVPHDPMGLVAAFGGNDVFVRELSDFFWKHREYRHDNEPGHQAPYQFVFAGRPDLTARIVRETIRNSYFASSHSMRGNDDCGQMSAWYLFSSFGFYPFDGFSATYVLGAPQIPEATLELPGGGSLHIVAQGLSEEAMYVSRVTFNGSEVKGPTISHAELMRGGELVFEMTPACAPASGGEVTMQNIAHRGMWDENVPQNTVEAIKRAYDSGATWVETDFHHTKAGQMVCIHQEGELKKYTGCTKKIADLTPEDVASLNLGEKDSLPRVYRIPLLDQVLAVVPKHGVLQSEIKGYSSQYADIFDAAVKEAGLSETNIVVSSFHYDALRDFKSRYPKYRCVWLVGLPRNEPFDAQKYIGKCRAGGIDVFCPGCSSTKGVMTPADADAIRAAGLEFRMYGVNSLRDMQQAKTLGAAGFTCNHWLKAFDWAAEVGGVKLLPAQGRPAGDRAGQ
ncbi:MAG: GH92 family glycosyl hydrolase [Kiritimatiellae bacterium]|nr:GH92 family glycosyl hydrolase [Kiritimatiellia bacterium]